MTSGKTISIILTIACVLVTSVIGSPRVYGDDSRPNIIFIMTDDHAAHAMSCYGSVINKTPQLDRLAREGMRFTNAFCTNAICAPSRATILTGKYSHMNGVMDNRDIFRTSQPTFPKLLQKAGYDTALIGKWHLKSDPVGFDYWNILPGQGKYYDPEMIEMGKKSKRNGYVTDLITEDSIKWLSRRPKDKPFMLLCQHKAPHRRWQPDERHAHMYEDKDIPKPETFDDDYSTRCEAASHQAMTIEHHLAPSDVKGKPPADLKGAELKNWKYQRYIKDYLRCIASVDDNIGKLLDFLEQSGLSENTIVVYTSDQGFFLGDHGWYDKRFMYEESLRMPLLIRWPGKIKPGSVRNDIVLNLDFAQTFLDAAGVKAPEEMQGRSMMPLLAGENPPHWRKSMYYHYYEYGHEGDGGWHRVRPHEGVRSQNYKLIHFMGEVDCWEFYDLKKDPNELNNVFDNPEYEGWVRLHRKELARLKEQYKDNALQKDSTGK